MEKKPNKDTELPKGHDSKEQRKRENETLVEKDSKKQKNFDCFPVQLEGADVVKLGQKTSLIAKAGPAKGRPRYAATWQRFVDNKEVAIDPISEKYTGSTIDLQGSKTPTLVINNTQKSDQGTYQLKLNGEADETGATNIICVQKMIRVLGYPVIKISGEERVEHDKRAVFIANVSFPDDIKHYTVKWQKMEDSGECIDLDLDKDKYNGSVVTLRPNKPLKLQINQVAMMDQGVYQLLVTRKDADHVTCMQKLLIVEIRDEWRKEIQYKFLNKFATEALRKYFVSVVPDSDLQKHLQVNETKLRAICTKQKKQYELNTLYPASGVITSNNLDTSLMYTVIRNTFTVPPPTNGWGKLPPFGTTQTDDVERVREHRNHQSHNFTTKDLNTKWVDLLEAIGRLGGNDLKKEAAAYKNKKIFESNDNERLAFIEDGILEIKKCIQDRGWTTPVKKEKSMILVPFKLQRKCGLCDQNFQRPARPPNDVVFRQQVPRSFYASHERKLKFDKVHYHVLCVAPNGNYDFVVDRDKFEGKIISEQHVQFLTQNGYDKLVDSVKRHNANVLV